MHIKARRVRQQQCEGNANISQQTVGVAVTFRHPEGGEELARFIRSFDSVRLFQPVSATVRHV